LNIIKLNVKDYVAQWLAHLTHNQGLPF